MMVQLLTEFENKVSRTQARELGAALMEAITIDQADMGNIQLFDEGSGKLHLLVQKGFDQPFLDKFKVVTPFDATACGKAIGLGAMVIIPDVKKNVGFQQYLPLIDFNAVRSIPVINNYNKRLGVLSTHFKTKKTVPKEHDLGGVIERIAYVLQSVINA